jgi:hypothetical protein
MKILLVSDIHPFSTKDVFDGYIDGFKSLNVPFETFEYHNIAKFFTQDIVNSLLLSKILSKENEFTHVLFVAGQCIPKWVFESKYDKKMGVIATDDPHCTIGLLHESSHVIDYYFSNELEIAKMNDAITYLPTAASRTITKENMEVGNDKYKSDMCFIGSVYPSRVPILEACIAWCEKNNKTIKIIGPVEARGISGIPFVPEDSIIRKVAESRLIDNLEAHKYYANSKACINLDRDINWNPMVLQGNPNLLECDPYSGNPRMYELALCKATQLYIGTRQEPLDIFGDSIFHCNDATLLDFTLSILFVMGENEINKMKQNAYDIVLKNHTYTHRAAKIIETFIRR